MIIKNEQDYRTASQRIDELISLDPEEGTELFEELDVISTQIESYESIHYEIETEDLSSE